MRRSILFCALLAACRTEGGVTPVVQQLDDAGEPVEQTSTTFACGDGNTCNVDVHACCAVGGTHACFPLANGCPASADAGTDAEAGPPPLRCTTYNNCGTGRECCYSPETGSVCMDQCPSGTENLCRRNVDQCGPDQDCDSLDEPPLPGIGRCRPD